MRRQTTPKKVSISKYLKHDLHAMILLLVTLAKSKSSVGCWTRDTILTVEVHVSFIHITNLGNPLGTWTVIISHKWTVCFNRQNIECSWRANSMTLASPRNDLSFWTDNISTISFVFVSTWHIFWSTAIWCISSLKLSTSTNTFGGIMCKTFVPTNVTYKINLTISHLSFLTNLNRLLRCI